MILFFIITSIAAVWLHIRREISTQRAFDDYYVRSMCELAKAFADFNYEIMRHIYMPMDYMLYNPPTDEQTDPEEILP